MILHTDTNNTIQGVIGEGFWGPDMEDKIVNIKYNDPVEGMVSKTIHIGDGTSDAVGSYTIKPHSGMMVYEGQGAPGYNYEYHGYIDKFNNQFMDYDRSRNSIMSSDGAFGFINPTDMYLGSQYYGEKFGGMVGGIFGDSGKNWGGTLGRFGGDVVGLIGGGIVGMGEGVGTSLGYAAATGNWIAPIDEAIIMGAGIGEILWNTGERLGTSLATGENQFNVDDVANVAVLFGMPVVSKSIAKVKANVKVKDISIARYDTYPSEISKETYGMGIYYKDKPIIGVSRGKIVTGGVPAPEYRLNSRKLYTAMDSYQVSHFRKTMENVGIDTARFDAGLNIAKTTYKSGEGVFKPTTYEIYSKNIPDSAKPAVLSAMEKYVKEGHGDIEVYGSNVQKMQIGEYQTREVGDMEMAVSKPEAFLKILDERLKKSDVGYTFRDATTDSPKVYFGKNKGIEVFKHEDKKSLRGIKKSLRGILIMDLNH